VAAVGGVGPIGWIVAGVIIGWLTWEQQGQLTQTFRMAAVASLILGLFSFMLPATPPTRSGEKVTVRDILGLDAIGLLKNRSYLVFFVSLIAICIPLAFYYNFTNLFLNEEGVRSAAAVQSLGQVSEVLFLLLLPFLLVRLGVKITLAAGMVACAFPVGSSRCENPAGGRDGGLGVAVRLLRLRRRRKPVLVAPPGHPPA